MPTIGSVLDAATPKRAPTLHVLRTLRRFELYAKSVGFTDWRNTPADDVLRTDRVAHYLSLLERDGRSAATQNRALAAVTYVWRRARRFGMVQSDPPPGLFQREGRGRKRVLSPEEEPRLMAALAAPYRALAALLLASGLRVSEALALEWGDVQYAEGTAKVVVRDSKNGDPRTVPVGARALSLALPVRLESATGPFTAVSQSAFNHAWAAARASMGLAADAEFVPHMLRHTYATRLVVAGVPLSVVARLLGHRSVRTTMRYSHVSDADAERWVRQVSGIH